MVYRNPFFLGLWAWVSLRFHRRLAGAIDSIVLFAESEVPGHNDQGPVVQGIVSLTSSLSGEVLKCFMTL